MERAPIMISSNYEKLLNITSKGGILAAFELYETVKLYSTIKANHKLFVHQLIRSIGNAGLLCYGYYAILLWRCGKNFG